ncbi:MAG: succinyl-diaminopimelate desuccinylase [Pseudomonadota bacterium]|nr:succinyl-diaminopimelate desuccinylase [Pseudomonadota bacterium]
MSLSKGSLSKGSLSEGSLSDDAHARVEALTLALCAIPSVTGNEAACAAWIEAALRPTGLTLSRVGATVLARGPDRGRPLLLLVGHTDTVPPARPAEGGTEGVMEAPRREGSRIVGLGASDMKGGLAVMLTLAERLDFAALPWDVGMVFYDREEGPWAESGLGPTLDAAPWLKTAALAFCLEPSDNDVQVGCLGTLHAEITFVGRAAHSARPWQGVNAIHAAGGLLMALGALAPVDVWCGEHLFREVKSATLASGGRVRNVIPDRFLVNVNFRFAPGRSVDDAEADLRAFVAASLPPGAPAPEILITERAPSGRVVTDNVHLQRFLAQTGNAVTAKQAWTDVARLSDAGVDAVNFGPGCSAQAHQAGEYAEVGLLHAAYDQLAHLLSTP